MVCVFYTFVTRFLRTIILSTNILITRKLHSFEFLFRYNKILKKIRVFSQKTSLYHHRALLKWYKYLKNLKKNGFCVYLKIQKIRFWIISLLKKKGSGHAWWITLCKFTSCIGTTYIFIVPIVSYTHIKNPNPKTINKLVEVLLLS